MTQPVRPSVNIALMLRDNLPAALRELDGQLRQAEQSIEELRRNRTTLAQIAIAAGIDTAPAPVVTAPAPVIESAPAGANSRILRLETEAPPAVGTPMGP